MHFSLDIKFQHHCIRQTVYIQYTFLKEFIFFFLLNTLSLKSSFTFTAKLSGCRDLHTPSAITHAQPPPSSTFPSRVVPLLQQMNPHWHIIITRSTMFTLGFTLGLISWTVAQVIPFWAWGFLFIEALA